jgi:hypothetical protein
MSLVKLSIGMVIDVFIVKDPKLITKVKKLFMIVH